MLEPGETLWVAFAPPGVVTSGPTVIQDLSKWGFANEETIQSYKEMGWKIVRCEAKEIIHEGR